ncbi:GNAT family N-acetyltransferase [Paenibacillus sp. FSL A5-0031]|uniref:GNAT family N-acetyltransferase n=1 Tax=Paenibacillus sp. FSL A5-0031 TaxID=1920420 RepID=UPI00096DD914|nr:GNAT family N-acetyltransferase [Paenibacillus sp. FSL A5-0031]OME87323.1 GNAT family N-acetyltransferase [Paenibacillus sp. FSL A5-0031]
MELLYDRFVISDDKSMLKIDTICGFLARSYWANKRSLEMIEESINNSVCFGVYDGDKQVGFARVVTDFATMYYLCDVFVDEEYRGAGLGKKLVEVITEQFEGMMGLLGTLDGHGLYEKYGFMKNTERFMNRRPR